MKKKYPIDNCDICFKENEKILGDCCGIKMCIECDSRLGGLCSICEKEELNYCYECEECGEYTPRMNTHICECCEKIYCDECLSINDAPIFVCLKDKCEENFYKEIDEYFAVTKIQDIWRNYFFKKYILD